MPEPGSPVSLYLNRELSWLAFNARVLHEATVPRVPLLEGVKFLTLLSSNLDE
jgi:polyphosphate kinase